MDEPDSSVGVATRYGLDGPGIESRWGASFSAPLQTGPGAHPTSYTMGNGSFPEVKRPGFDVDHQPPSSTAVKERIELYLYSPSGPSWPVLEQIYFTFTVNNRLFSETPVKIFLRAQDVQVKVTAR